MEWVERATADVATFEALLMGLRLVEGVDVEALRTRTGVDVRQVHAGVIAELVAAGLLVSERERLRATKRGFELLSWMLRKFVP